VLGLRKMLIVNSLAVHWLAFTPKGPGSVPSQGTKIPQAMQCSKKKKKYLLLKLLFALIIISIYSYKTCFRFFFLPKIRQEISFPSDFYIGIIGL